jgi:hypothetical protein
VSQILRSSWECPSCKDDFVWPMSAWSWIAEVLTGVSIEHLGTGAVAGVVYGAATRLLRRRDVAKTQLLSDRVVRWRDGPGTFGGGSIGSDNQSAKTIHVESVWLEFFDLAGDAQPPENHFLLDWHPRASVPMEEATVSTFLNPGVGVAVPNHLRGRQSNRHLDVPPPV